MAALQGSLLVKSPHRTARKRLLNVRVRARVFASILMLLLVGIPVAGAQPAPTDDLRTGDDAYAEFDNVAALAAYVEASKDAPENFDVLTRLARTYVDHAMDLLADGNKKAAEKNFEIALDYAKVLLQHHDDRAESHFYMAAALGRLAQFQGGKGKVKTGRDVERYCKAAIERDPNFPPTYVALGVFNREVAGLNWIQRTAAKTFFGGVPDGSNENAVTLLTKAVTLDPSLNAGYFELAQTYMAIGDKTNAVWSLRKTIETLPFNSEDVRNRAKAKALLDDLEN